MSELSKLKWQCRRGTLELDILLTRYLECSYCDANEEEKASFIQLLELEDTVLIPYLMGDREPKDADLLCLVKKIHRLSPAK